MSDSETQLLDLAKSIVDRARHAGADVAEAKARSGWELTTKVRLGEPELVQEAGHKSLSLRVMRGQRVAMTSTSDLSEPGIERLIHDALDLALLTEPDDCAGPAAPELLCSPPHPDLQLFDPSIGSIDAERALQIAEEAERAALDSDERLKLSEGATFSRVTGSSAMVLSSGFEGVERGSYASLVVSPVVEDAGGKKRRGHYWTAKRFLEDLEDHCDVGREAARRTLRRLGAKKIPTGESPVVFDPDTARSIVGLLAGCVVGGSIWRKSSYLMDREGSQVASERVTIIDDPFLERGPGSRPYDGEGLRSRKHTVVDSGKLETYLLDSYSARKLKRESTANAQRSGGSIGASTTNFVLQPGTMSRDDLIASTPRGLYVTEMMGFGFNAVTGDFSRGASGFLIENGKLTQPVTEVTVSGNLDAMLKGIDAIANDLDIRTSIAAPTFRIAKMTISGS